MKEYPNNFIGVNQINPLDQEMRDQYPKAKGWLPFEAYDLIQCGYPYSDHGEMIIRPDGGTNEKSELIPSRGMWCKVKDVKKMIDILKCERKFCQTCILFDQYFNGQSEEGSIDIEKYPDNCCAFLCNDGKCPHNKEIMDSIKLKKLLKL